MQLFKKALPLFAAIALAVLTLGCGAPAATPDDTGTASEGFASVNGTKNIVTSGEDQIIPAEIVVEDGMSLSFFGRLDEGEVEAAVSKDGEWLYTDYLYDGYGFSVYEVGPGTYEVEISAIGATGEVYLAALPTGQYNMEDFADAEEVVTQVLEDLGQA